MPEHVIVLHETPIELALFGMGLSHGLTSGLNYFEFSLSHEKFSRALKVAKKLAPLDKGHNKFLESMIVFLDINASRAFWQEFDTYRVGVTKQSESTMHTIKKRELTEEDFTTTTHPEAIRIINDLKYFGAGLVMIKDSLPEGFLQRRIVCTNYKTLKNIITQRKNHKYPFWNIFIKSVLSQLTYNYFLEH